MFERRSVMPFAAFRADPAHFGAKRLSPKMKWFRCERPLVTPSAKKEPRIVARMLAPGQMLQARSS
jgi:hypothetical protein